MILKPLRYIIFALYSHLLYNFSLCSNFYSNSSVKLLSGEDFLNVVNRNPVSVVEFHKDNCSPCKEFSNVYKNFATVFERLLPVVSVNDESLSQKYGVKSFPYVKLFIVKGPNTEPLVVDFKGDKDVESLVQFTLSNLNKVVKDKASKYKSKDNDHPKTVVQLSSSNFKSTVLDDTYSQWLVKFYAPWCGHCQSLEPEWMKLPKMSKSVKVGRVDCTLHQSLCSDYKIKGYPTILLFNKGDKSLKNAVNYQGARRAKDILEFAKSRDKNISPPVHAETVSVLKEKCSGPLCLLFFLPEASKEDHLKTMTKLVTKSSMPFSLTYTLVGEHEQWENAFRLKEFPAVVGLNYAKGVFLPMNSTFSKETLSSFVSSILSGKATGQKLAVDLVDKHTEL